MLKILTHQGLIRLRALVAANPRLALVGLERLAIEHEGLEFVESKYDFKDEIILAKSWRGADDTKVANLILDALPGLTASDACDERLWVSLAHGPFHEYVVSRWGKSLKITGDENALKKFFINHILVAGVRSRWRNQALSRLWWQAFYVKSLGVTDESGILKLLLSNTEFAGQVLGKPSIGTSVPLARALLKVSFKVFVTEGQVFDRAAFRKFMKQLDLLAGRRLLTSLPGEDLELEFEALMRVCLE
jgi:hypothetical protein